MADDDTIRRQATIEANLINAQKDIDNIAEAHRRDYAEIAGKVEELENSFKFYKAIIALIGSSLVGFAYLVSWIIENMDKIKGVFK